MLDAIKRVVDDNFVFQQGTGVSCVQRILPRWRKTLNFLSPELWPRNSPELNSTDYNIRESYSSISMSCEKQY